MFIGKSSLQLNTRRHLHLTYILEVKKTLYLIFHFVSPLLHFVSIFNLDKNTTNTEKI